MTNEEVKIKARAYLDPLYFGRSILGYDLLDNQVHGDMFGFIISSRGKQCVLLEPRDCFKTTAVSVAYVMWILVNDATVKILINHKVRGKAVAILEEIRGHFESNPRFKHFFGDMRGKRWGRDGFDVKSSRVSKEFSVTAGGVDHEVVGGHYNLIINDDLSGLRDMYSAAEREHVLRFYKSLPFIRDSGRFMGEINIGTRWAEDDIYRYMMAKTTPDCVRVRSALLDADLPTERSYFPSRLPVAQLKKERADDEVFFYSQRQNEPRALVGKSFALEHFKFYEPESLKLDTAIIFGYADLAISQRDTADYTAMIAGAKIGPEIFIIGAQLGRYSADQLEIVLAEFASTYGIVQFGVENNAFQQILVTGLKERIRKQAKFCDVIPVTNTSDKIMRVNSCAGLIKDRVKFRADWETAYPLLIRQTLDFPGTHDDGPDALAGLIKMLAKPEPTVRFI